MTKHVLSNSSEKKLRATKY